VPRVAPEQGTKRGRQEGEDDEGNNGREICEGQGDWEGGQGEAGIEAGEGQCALEGQAGEALVRCIHAVCPHPQALIIIIIIIIFLLFYFFPGEAAAASPKLNLAQGPSHEARPDGRCSLRSTLLQRGGAPSCAAG
jgi:hypothetical protein